MMDSGKKGQGQPEEQNKQEQLEKQEQDKKGREDSVHKKTDQLKMTVEKLRLKKSKAVKFGIIAAAVAVAAIVLCIYIYMVQYNQTITVIVPIGDVTFTEKNEEETEFYVTFHAADYNRIPAQVNEKGVKVHVDKETYDMLVLKVEYDSADVIFEVPQGVARKVGYSVDSMNYQTLWTENILARYTSIRSIVWSAK